MVIVRKEPNEKIVGLGKMPLPLRGKKYFLVYGGPYRQKPDNLIGVKMAKEINLPCTVDIPTVDFSVPPKEAMQKGLIEAVNLVLSGEPVYVGCMGGKGRTGLFLAILAKAFEVEDPVTYVRRQYYRHAVETVEQNEYVDTFPIPRAVRRAIFWAKVKSWFSAKNHLTNGGLLA